MALVYEAYDPFIDRTLAIKMLREERCLDEENRARFLREAKAAGNLSHPHIVTIHDIGEVNNRPYIVMELLEGETLEEMLKYGEALAISDAVDIGIQLATALHYAHDNGVVHRDIKPSNIVCTNSRDDKINVKITDFGIAHVTDSNLTRGTDTGALLGTPYNISPEQVRGGSIDGRADLFSLGITMYHLFCGQRPFVGTNIHTLLLQIATEEHRPINNVSANFPLQLKTVIDKCLRKDPDARYQTGDELAIALQDASDDIQKRGAKVEKNHLLPVPLKHTLLITILLFITVTMTSIGAIYLQKQSLQQDFQKFGINMSKYVADQITESMVRQDWLAVELFIQHIEPLEPLQRISITDHENKIRGDTFQNEINTHLQSPEQNPQDHANKAQVLIYAQESTKPIRYAGIVIPTGLSKILNLQSVSEFHATMSYGQRYVGKVVLTLSPSGSYKALLDSVAILVVLYLISVITVIPVIYFISRANETSLKLLQNAMNDIASGNYSQRIDSIPLNETGETFSAYNNMADKIQQRDMRIQSSQQSAG